jgi:hypothetical protein
MERVHHISGRLRLRLPRLRQRAASAQRLEIEVSKCRGIVFAKASSATGSLLIRYDSSRVTLEALLDVVRTAAAQLDLLDAPRPAQAMSASPAVKSVLADKLVDLVVGKLVERSAIALVGALL